MGKTNGIKFKDKLGYALGDMGGILTFSLIGAFQNKFYTDALGISPGKIAILILVARIWDAINDPLWGAFIDSRKPTKHGRFRPYIFWFSIPLAVTAFLMFIKVPGWSETKYLVFAYITYILYGMMYTAVNIPYGSLASVITDDEKERSSLSIWRSIGSGLGGLPGTIILPMIVFTTVKTKGNEVQILNPSKLTICVAILAALSIVVFFFHFKMTKERIAPPANQASKYNAFRSIIALFKNRPFITLSIAAMLLIAFQFYYQATFTYLFSDYYGKPKLYSMVTICTYLPMLIIIPTINKLIDKFGKKELCAAGMALAAVASLILYIIQTPSPYVFLVFTFFSGFGQTFFILEVWALNMDAIDYHEVKMHRREEGTAYAVFSFIRKLGHTLAGVGLNALLEMIKYDGTASSNGEVLPKEVLSKLYDISTLIPAITLAILALILFFGYNLSKKKLAEMHIELDKIRNSEETI